MNNKTFLLTSLILLVLTIGSFFSNKILSNNNQQIYQKSIKQNNILGEIYQNNKILEINQTLDNNQCPKPQENLKKQIEKNNTLIGNLKIEIDDKGGILANILNYSKIKKYQNLIQENNKLIEEYNNQVLNYNRCIFSKNKY